MSSLDKNVLRELINIVKSQLHEEDYMSEIVEYDQIELLARKHDIAQFVYYVTDNPKKNRLIARVMLIDYTAHMVMKLFDESKISYIPLKGTIIRSMYPKFWMRTSCDVDILVHEEDLDRAVDTLLAAGWRVASKKNFHDISLFSPNNIHLELHYNIKENINSMDLLLEKVWEFSALDSGYCYKESPEFFLFHHIAHMAYHFQGGGCGIRPFIDLWVLEHKLHIDEVKYKALIKEAKLEKFEKQAFRLEHYWFENGESDELIENMERYIVLGGVYGSPKQSMIIKQEKFRGRIGYFIHRIIMPYESMIILYPILKKHKWLLPFMEIHRWGKAISARERIVEETKIALNVQKDYSIDMMKELGL